MPQTNCRPYRPVALLNLKPLTPEGTRSVPPIHHGLVARCLIHWDYSLSRAFDLEGEAAMKEWNRLVESLTFEAKDPAWRSQPSVLDRIRGRHEQPLPKRRARPTIAAPSAK